MPPIPGSPVGEPSLLAPALEAPALEAPALPAGSPPLEEPALALPPPLPPQLAPSPHRADGTERSPPVHPTASSVTPASAAIDFIAAAGRAPAAG
ncbi:MAG TPA: hypothetical protein VMG12_11125 [Polyangiaceae bacterium]|nr:hypothetical protein [Polyangiaceae bacterium]